jgi:hypothetical protein
MCDKSTDERTGCLAVYTCGHLKASQGSIVDFSVQLYLSPSSVGICSSWFLWWGLAVKWLKYNTLLHHVCQPSCSQDQQMMM